MKISVIADRGRDLGQGFGSLFEAQDNRGVLTIGAGFQNQYNTRYRGPRHTLHVYVRPTDGDRTFETETLPRHNDLCGTYLYSRDGTVYSTYGGVRAWNAEKQTWEPAPETGGSNETMRVGNDVLQFGDSCVLLNGRTVLAPPDQGTYQLFFYANGHLCFYHVNRGDGGYRPYEEDAKGFSKLYACPWVPGAGDVVLGNATVLTLPIVGETTFAWAQFRDQILTGSNIGGFYVFENSAWRMLRKPELNRSYQLYSTVTCYDRLLMGQYPTGRVFSYDGTAISEPPGWPPVMPGVADRAREAQTMALYGGDLFVGVWPWAEVWRYSPDNETWTFVSRMFPHPPLSDTITHPYDEENRGGAVTNQWGQRVTSLIPNGADLFISTSAKWPCRWNEDDFPFLAPEKWKSYGTVYRLTMPGHLTAETRWTEGATRFEVVIGGPTISISQDGQQLAETVVGGTLSDALHGLTGLSNVAWGEGLYGPFGGRKLDGKIR